MANICSVSLNLEFRTKKDKKAFKETFQKKMATAEKRNEGLRISRNKWLFDASVSETGARSLLIYGTTRWSLEQSEMVNFHKTLNRMKVIEYTCYYEETSNLIYGKYTFEDGELWDCYVGNDNPVWNKAYTGDEDYFDDLDHALETEGVLEQVA